MKRNNGPFPLVPTLLDLSRIGSTEFGSFSVTIEYYLNVVGIVNSKAMVFWRFWHESHLNITKVDFKILSVTFKVLKGLCSSYTADLFIYTAEGTPRLISQFSFKLFQDPSRNRKVKFSL
ncbi:hypothetical protein XENOCAPTIV_008589 [Xenoophorus captivus]|uniref:Uncharacterized protein n=1 Tax=Xenoophorus captivus TaxID=1517983 RepID=A0ABV0QQQ3_9TELE